MKRLIGFVVSIVVLSVLGLACGPADPNACPSSSDKRVQSVTHELGDHSYTWNDICYYKTSESPCADLYTPDGDTIKICGNFRVVMTPTPAPTPQPSAACPNGQRTYGDSGFKVCW